MLGPLCNQTVTEDRLQNSVKIYSFYFKAQQRQKLTTRTAWGYSLEIHIFRSIRSLPWTILRLWGFSCVRVQQNDCIIINGGYHSRQFHSLRQNINSCRRMRLGEHLWTLCLSLYRCPLKNSLTVKCMTLLTTSGLSFFCSLSSKMPALVSRVSRLGRSRARALPLLNRKKKRDCSQSNYTHAIYTSNRIVTMRWKSLTSEQQFQVSVVESQQKHLWSKKQGSRRSYWQCRYTING